MNRKPPGPFNLEQTATYRTDRHGETESMYLVMYDTETSGLSPWKAEIIQIAAVAYQIEGREWQQVGEFERKLRFDESKASQEALEMNCYDPLTWETEAIDSHDALSDFNNWCKPYRDVERVSKKSGKSFYNLRTGGHNVASFDAEFVRSWYKKHNEFCPMDYSAVIDTLHLARSLFTLWFPEYPLENHKLETLCGVYGIELTDAHDALADVKANGRLLWAMRHTKPKLEKAKEGEW